LNDVSHARLFKLGNQPRHAPLLLNYVAHEFRDAGTHQSSYYSVQ
jgi:hypothetical protein